MDRLLVSVPECAKALGISVRSVHRYCKLGVLPYVRISKRKLFRVSDLIHFAEAGLSVERLRRAKAELGLT